MAKPYPDRILFMRHGQTAYNAENRLQGQRDVPLDGKGREQARAIGRLLRDNLASEIARFEAAGAFWASPLGRARETMELARAAIGLPPRRYHIDARLMELTFGDWEGLTWDQVEAEDPDGARARRADKWRFAPPHGESYANLVARLTPWLDEREGELFVVSHGGVGRALMAMLADLAPEIAASANIWQGRALIFEAGGFSWVG